MKLGLFATSCLLLLLICSCSGTAAAAAADDDDDESNRILRRPAPVTARPTPNNNNNNNSFTAAVLILKSSSSTTVDVVTPLFEASLRELIVSSGTQLTLAESPTVAAEFDQGADTIIILCVETFGDVVMDGLEAIDDPRRKRRRRRQLRNRRDEPYYVAKVDRRRRRTTFSVDNLLAMMNFKSSTGMQVEALFVTDSTICGDKRVDEKNTPIPTPAPTIIQPSTPTVTTTTDKPSVGPSSSPTTWVPSVTPSIQPTVTTTETPSVGPSSSPTWIPSVTPSIQPTVTTTETPSVGPSSSPTWIPSVTPSTSLQPSMSPSFQPSTSNVPSVSFQPTISFPPSLPPPDWEQFGSVIIGDNIQKIVFSDSGTLLGTIFNSVETVGRVRCFTPGGCGRFYQNPNLSNWNQVGPLDVVVDAENNTLVDLALSGDGTRAAFVSIADDDGADGLQERRVQILSVPDLQPVGSSIVDDQLGFDAKSKTSICLSTDGSLLTMGMGNGENGVNLVQAWSFQAGSWSKLGAVLNTTYSEATMEYSGDCRTVAITNKDTRSYIFELGSTAWTSRDVGFPSTKFSSIALDSDGSKLAARSFSATGLIDIYEYVQNSWTMTASIVSGQVYEGNFGFKLDLSSQGETVAIATFRVQGTLVISCTQAFQYNSTAWNPLGRPPCLSLEQGHAGFGAYLALSGEGHTLAVGGIGSFYDRLDTGHIHTYEYIERV